MHISESTIKLLNNFAKINQNLMLNEGNLLKTVNVEKTVIAVAHIEDSFDESYGIYDLSEFLNTIGMFNDPELEFHGDVLTISDSSDGNIQTKYYAANPEVLTKVPDMKEIPSGEETFTLSSKNFKRLERGGNTLKLNALFFEAKNGILTASVQDKDGKNKNLVSVGLTDKYSGEDFSVHISLHKMTILDGDYECSIHGNRILVMKNTERDLTYVIAIDVE